MIDADDTLRSELEQLVPRDSRRDWEEVASAAGLVRERARRRLAAGAALVAAVAILAVSTPLGAGLVRSLDDFSAWLSGDPGTPAAELEQREFEEANRRSWLQFPQGTTLRKLTATQAGESTVELFGFRSGASSFCLRVKVTGETPSAFMECAPLEELRRAGGPARAIVVDHGVGRGDKSAWYGIDKLRSSAMQITAGIAADAVPSVVLEDEAGRHEVATESNAFLYVAEAPDVAQRVKRIWARTGGGLVAIPFAQAPHGYLGGPPPAQAPEPPKVDRELSGGRIGWLEAHEPRGEALDVLPANLLSRRAMGGKDVLFGRVLTPDPDRPLRIVVTLNGNRPGGPPAGLCTWLATRGGAAGGCTPYPDIFERTQLTYTASSHSPGAFLTASGVASDHVARIEALFADGQSTEASLEDNAFAIDLPRSNLPARLVAYDARNRVIEASEALSDHQGPAGPARGRAELVLQVRGAEGAKAELFVGPGTDGGQCFYVKDYVDESHGGVGVHCVGRVWTGPHLQIGTAWSPPRFVKGRVHPDVKSVRIRFADGSATTLTPTRGFILWAVPEKHFPPTKAPAAAEGLDANGAVVARQRLEPPLTRSRRSPSRR